MAIDTLLTPLRASAACISPAIGSQARTARRWPPSPTSVTLADAGPPTFDLLFIGIGPDAHILSLFPGQSSLRERERLVVGVPEAGMEPFVPRVTHDARRVRARRAHVVVLATGSGKAEAIATRVRAPTRTPSFDAPASLLQARLRAGRAHGHA